MTIASLYWARVLAAWSRAQAFLRRLRREKPQFYRFALEVPVGVALSALFYADVISDIIVASSLRDTGNPGWTFLAALFIVLPYLASYASVAAYLLRAYGARAAFFAFLALGLPSGVLLLDVAMFAAPLTLLRELPDSPAATQLKLFLPSYRSTRVLFEAALETLPQSALQLHIYVALTHYGASTAFESKMAPLVAISFAFSVVNLIKTLVVLVVDARAAGVPLRAHLAQQLALGQGLPLHALKAGALDVWRCECTKNRTALLSTGGSDASGGCQTTAPLASSIAVALTRVMRLDAWALRGRSIVLPSKIGSLISKGACGAERSRLLRHQHALPPPPHPDPSAARLHAELAKNQRFR